MESSYENSEKIFTHKDDLLKNLQNLEIKIEESEKKRQRKKFRKT